tara:strand:+ start:1505 stop:1663 length:159 start_codon:yes stop_codon:yes gene_type:complete
MSVKISSFKYKKIKLNKVTKRPITLIIQAQLTYTFDLSKEGKYGREKYIQLC